MRTRSTMVLVAGAPIAEVGAPLGFMPSVHSVRLGVDRSEHLEMVPLEHLATVHLVVPVVAPSAAQDEVHLDAAAAQGTVARLPRDPVLHKTGQHSARI